WRMSAACSPAAGATASRSDPSGASTRRIWKASCAGAALPDGRARSRDAHSARTTREVASHANGLKWELATRSSSGNRRRAIGRDLSAGHDRRPDQLHGVTRPAPGPMLDLLAARHTGGGDQRVAILRTDRGEK